MAYMTNREFAEHEYKRQKRNAYADALVKEVRRLREEIAEREKGCEYCQSRFEIATHYITNTGMKAGTNKSVNFCPMCGKSLKEVSNETQDY